MKRWTAYLAVAGVAVFIPVVALWTKLEGPDRLGLAWAAGLALATQGVAFGLLIGLRKRARGFLLALAGGTMLRLGVLGAAGVVVTVVETGVGAETLLLGLAGYLFALALLEAWFLRDDDSTRQSG